jgi:hypothetical protein
MRFRIKYQKYHICLVANQITYGDLPCSHLLVLTEVTYAKISHMSNRVSTQMVGVMTP